MNDKCAAGTGRFLEVMARALEINLDEFGAMSLKAKNPAAISSLCTVFAESEVISLISKGVAREDIVAGIHESIASRIAALATRAGLTTPVMVTGGVAKNIGLIKALEKLWDLRQSYPNTPRLPALSARQCWPETYPIRKTFPYIASKVFALPLAA